MKGRRTEARMLEIEGLLLSESELTRKLRKKSGWRLMRLPCRMWLERKVQWQTEMRFVRRCLSLAETMRSEPQA